MDKENAKKLHIQYAPMLQRIAFSYLKHVEDAEDAVSESYIRLLQSSPAFDSDEHAKAWLLRTVINICKDIKKAAWSRKVVLQESTVMENHIQIPAYGIEDDLLDLVLQLPEKYRVPLYLFYYEGYSIREIANMLEVAEPTVKTHLKRGRENIKKLYEDK